MPQDGLACLNKTWIRLNMSEFSIIDRVLNIYHTINITLQVNDYLLRNRRIQNPVKDLRWIALEKWLWFLIIFVKNSIFKMVLNMCQVLNMWVLKILKFSWIWQGSEYASGYNYGRVLNIPGFWVCQISAFANDAQGFEYAWIWLHMVGFWICLVNVSQGFK